jgi:hypothetical protein
MELNKMTKKQLQDELRTYEDLIHGAFPCFGTKDLRYLDNIYHEIDKRGFSVSIIYKLI